MKTALSCILATLAVSLLHAADWTCYRGPDGDGVVKEKNLNFDWPATGPSRLWTANLGDGGGGTFGGPVIVGGRVYVPSRTANFTGGKDASKDSLVCLNSADGKELWRFEFDSPAAAQIGYGSGPRASPLVHDGLVYQLSAFGMLVCVDADKGQKLWERNLIVDFNGFIPKFGVAAAPVIDGELLICEPGGKDAALVALDRHTGKEVWRSGESKSSYAPPQLVTLCGVRQILAYPFNGVVGLNIADGKELWRIRYDDQKNIASPIVHHDTITVSNVSYGMSQFEISNKDGKWAATKKWTNEALRLDTCAPIKEGEHIYAYLYNKKEVNCISLADGSVTWTAKFEGAENAQLLLAAPGRLIATMDTGILALFEVTPKAGVEKYRFQAVGKNAFGCPVIADGRLFVRDTQKLECFSLAPR
jgi:outer membrane protein assembly factor BamB